MPEVRNIRGTFTQHNLINICFPFDLETFPFELEVFQMNWKRF